MAIKKAPQKYEEVLAGRFVLERYHPCQIYSLGFLPITVGPRLDCSGWFKPGRERESIGNPLGFQYSFVKPGILNPGNAPSGALSQSPSTTVLVCES